MPVRYILSSVWVRLSIFSQLSNIQSNLQYVGLCVFSLPTPLVMIEIIYIVCLIITIKSEVWTITHCLGLCHETMVCAVCLSIFLLVMWYSPGSNFTSNVQHIYIYPIYERLTNSRLQSRFSGDNDLMLLNELQYLFIAWHTHMIF